MLTEKQKSDWIAALRSGEYKQGSRDLRDVDGNFCCLGVLTEINGWSFENETYLSGEGALAVKADAATGTGNLRSMGLPTPYRHGVNNFINLAAMNDAGVSFAEIADFLEEHLPTCKS